jgi:glutamyl-tRNA reductase
MNYLLIGVNHHSAPVAVREKLAISASALPEVTRRLAQHPGVEEGMVLSTCNRVELLARCTNGSADLRGFLREYFRVDTQQFEPYLYELRQNEAVRHVFRVASSLDSMVVGEPQILGQVKDAYAVARAVGAVHSHMDALVSRAFAVAKRVRNETAIGTSAVSVASVAVELAEKIFGSLKGKTGAGKMSELAARHLMAHGAGAIVVTNRTFGRAVELAEKFGGATIRFEEIYDHADRADIIITSTGAPVSIFKREHAERFLAKRRNNPIFFIDIAVPRDVDPAVNQVEGVFVYDIDDLQSVVASHVSDRQREAHRAEAIIEEELQRFHDRAQALHVVPTIISLQEQMEAIRQAELERVRSKLGKLSAEQEQAIEALSRGIVNKVLHTPITTLKTAAKDPEGSTIVEVIRRVFNLGDRDKRE